MKMKQYIIPSLAAIILACSCAKDPATPLNEANKVYFDAWIQVFHPELEGKSQFPGYYILKDTPGSGDLVGDSRKSPYILADYRITDLNGNILSSTYESDAYKLHSHTKNAFYGATVFERVDDALYAGLDYGIETMRIGGTRQLIIPGWLITNNRYKTEQEYMDNVEGDSGIYEISIKQCISDINQWENDSLIRYANRHHPKAIPDTSGFLRDVIVPHKGDPFDADTTIYVRYIGRRLDGVVFDTNVADTAKAYGFYSDSQDWKPMKVKWTKNSSKITVGDNDSPAVTGFSYLLGKMGPYEKAVAMFTSDLGYSYYGSGSAIPSYCPLSFEVEIVDYE